MRLEPTSWLSASAGCHSPPVGSHRGAGCHCILPSACHDMGCSGSGPLLSHLAGGQRPLGSTHLLTGKPTSTDPSPRTWRVSTPS